MIDSVGREAQQVVDGDDRQKEASELADAPKRGRDRRGCRRQRRRTGAIVTIAASTAAADVTGLVMASLVAAIGFFVIGQTQERQR